MTELNEFMTVLDARLERKEPHPVGLVARKVRKAGSPSKTLPPVNAPVWCINPTYKDGECMHSHSICFTHTHVL